MPPILVHVAENEALAEILKDVLRQHGIEATVTPASGWRSEPVPGENAWLGELACEIWIAHEGDLERARGVVSDFRAPSVETPAWNWRCAKCGETSEAQFTECWKCGASKA